MKYGIAFFDDDGYIIGKLIGWRQKNGSDETWDTYADALEANDLGGWTGYVMYYPSGRKPSDNDP